MVNHSNYLDKNCFDTLGPAVRCVATTSARAAMKMGWSLGADALSICFIPAWEYNYY